MSKPDLGLLRKNDDNPEAEREKSKRWPHSNLRDLNFLWSLFLKKTARICAQDVAVLTSNESLTPKYMIWNIKSLKRRNSGRRIDTFSKYKDYLPNSSSHMKEIHSKGKCGDWFSSRSCRLCEFWGSCLDIDSTRLNAQWNLVAFPNEWDRAGLQKWGMLFKLVKKDCGYSPSWSAVVFFLYSCTPTEQKACGASLAT